VENVNETVSSSFRFFSLNKLQAFTLEREISAGSQKKHPKKDCYLGCVTLKSDNLEDIFDFFIRQRIEACDCDILISIASKKEANIIDVPGSVNRMLKFIDCKLTVSYIMTQDAL
jgi:hypothetical protein